MAKKTEAFVDTSAFIAFLDRSDTYHTLFRGLFANPPPLVTSPLVIAEGHGWFLKRFDSSKGIDFLNFIEELTALKIFPVGPKELKEGSRLIKKYSDQPLTLADAVGLYLLNHLKINNCWSTDRHLSLTGVTLVIYQ